MTSPADLGFDVHTHTRRKRGGTRDVVNPVVREPAQPDGLDPVKVLERVDGRLLVYDPARPLGDLAKHGAKLEDVVKVAWRVRESVRR